MRVSLDVRPDANTMCMVWGHQALEHIGTFGSLNENQIQLLFAPAIGWRRLAPTTYYV